MKINQSKNHSTYLLVDEHKEINNNDSSWINFNDVSTLVILVSIVSWVFTQIRKLEKRDEEKYNLVKEMLDKTNDRITRTNKNIDKLNDKIELDNKDEQIIVNHLSSIITQNHNGCLNRIKVVNYRTKMLELYVSDMTHYLQNQGYKTRRNVISLDELFEDDNMSNISSSSNSCSITGNQDK